MKLRPVLLDTNSVGVGAGAASTAQSVRSADRWVLDAEGWRLKCPDGRSLMLNDAERRLLLRLLADEGNAVAHADLIAALQVAAEDFDLHRLEMLIHRLRRKALGAFDTTLPLHSVRGRGYAFHANAPQRESRDAASNGQPSG